MSLLTPVQSVLLPFLYLYGSPIQSCNFPTFPKLYFAKAETQILNFKIKSLVFATMEFSLAHIVIVFSSLSLSQYDTLPFKKEDCYWGKHFKAKWVILYLVLSLLLLHTATHKNCLPLYFNLRLWILPILELQNSTKLQIKEIRKVWLLWQMLECLKSSYKEMPGFFCHHFPNA